MSESNGPVYLARATVSEKENAETGETEKFVRTIGAVFPFNSGKNGYVVNLHSIPTNWDGTFILVPPGDRPTE